MTPEGEVQKAVIAALETIPRSRWARNNTGVARNGRRVIRYGLGVGSPDIIGCCNGRFVGIECKAPGGRQSPGQAQWAAEWRAVGAIYIVGDSPAKILSALGEALTECCGYEWHELRML